MWGVRNGIYISFVDTYDILHEPPELGGWVLSTVATTAISTVMARYQL